MLPLYQLQAEASKNHLVPLHPSPELATILPGNQKSPLIASAGHVRIAGKGAGGIPGTEASSLNPAEAIKHIDMLHSISTSPFQALQRRGTKKGTGRILGGKGLWWLLSTGDEDGPEHPRPEMPVRRWGVANNGKSPIIPCSLTLPTPARCPGRRRQGSMELSSAPGPWQVLRRPNLGPFSYCCSKNHPLQPL